MSALYFHFTVGPVQSFVAEARRTKDFWAGSFLLGYLSGVAMAATEEMGGKILFPLPDKEYLDVICGASASKPRQGNIPNRFKAEVPTGFDAQKVLNTVLYVWSALAEEVWSNDLEGYEATPTRIIWERQIGSFWEMSWAMSGDEAASNLLDRRKNWRIHLPPAEPGQKCAIMAGFQELSGEEIAQSQAQKAFWKELRESKKDFDLDIGENERLCALAFMKRRFVRHFKNFRCTTETITAYGWELSPNVPSVALLAAAPWLASVAEHDKIGELITAAHAIHATEMPLSELTILKKSGNREVLRLDGTVLFDTLLDNRNIYPDKAKAETVKQALRPLYKENTPSPFYAILMMDGDHLGMQMSDPSKQMPISEALQLFTNRVQKIVEEYSGFLVYAGGDDVLAILPLETALSCAAKLRRSYEEAFESKAKNVTTSISAAVIYSHIKNPLHAVLHDIHSLLDDVAKEKTGRDAIAVQTMKPGGIQLTWTKKWNDVLNDGKFIIEELAEAYRAQTEKGQYSSGFFYRIREILELLEGVGDREKKEKILAVEYRAGTNIKQGEALEIIRPLLAQCTGAKGELQSDGALLLRFLAQKGVE